MSRKDQNDTQAGVIHLAVPLFLLILVIIGAIVVLYAAGFLQRVPLPGLKKEATVNLQKQYQNPFDQNTQYVNPFSSYKNPFDQLK